MSVNKLTIESNRTLGGVAAILTLLGIFSTATSLLHYFYPGSTGLSLLNTGVGGIFGALAIVGFLLFLIAMYGFSKDYTDHRIFSYLMYGLIITIIAVVAITIIAVAIILFNFATFFPNLGSSTLSPPMSSSFSKTFGVLTPLFGLVGIIWIVFVVRAFNLLSDKSKVPLFKTGAKVLLAGALVNIVIAIIVGAVEFGSNISLSLNNLLALLTIGSVVQEVAWILLAKAYFSIQVSVSQTLPAQPPFQVPSSTYTLPVFGQVKYCSHCGAPNQLDAIYCTRCGQKL